MSTDGATPDLIFVNLIHQALRVDGARLLVTIEALDDQLESQARKATPRGQSGFLIPWLAEHASPEQRKAWFGKAPPLRIVYRLNRRRYRRLDEALLPAG